MTWRALIVGDVHLRTDDNTDDTVAALEIAAQVAQAQSVDAVLFGGDIYEKASTPHERAIFARVLGYLSNAHVYGVRGNHDAHEDLEVFNHLPNNTWVETPAIIEAGPVDILMVPWPDRGFLAAVGHAGEEGDRAGSTALAAMLRGIVALHDPKRPLILNAHLQVLGALSSSAQPLIGKSIEAVLGDLLDLGLTAGFISHVHKPQQLAPGIEYVGSLTVHDFGEEEEEKRVGILTIDDSTAASVEWLPTPCRRWVTIEAFVGQEDESEYETGQVYESLGGHLMDGWHPSQIEVRIAGANLRYRFTCTEEQQHLFDHTEIERRFARAHTLKIVPQVERAERVRAAEVAAARSLEEKFRAYCQVIDLAVTEHHIEKLHELESELMG